MNEVGIRHFQIDPYQWTDDDAWNIDDGRCMYMNHCFSVCDIKRITPVHTKEHRSFFWFTVQFRDDHEIKLDFATKADALKAQRVLAAAYTRTGDFKIEQRRTENVESEE